MRATRARAVGLSRQRSVVEGWHAGRWFAPPGGGATPAADEPIDILMKSRRTITRPQFRRSGRGDRLGCEIRDEGATAARKPSGSGGLQRLQLRIRRGASGNRISASRPHRSRCRSCSRADRAAAFNNEFAGEHLRLLPHVRAAVESDELACAATTSDHDRGRLQHPSPARREGEIVRAPGSWCSAAGDAHRSWRRGLVGGAGASSADLDFASVQRGNPEISVAHRKSSTRAGRSAPRPDPADHDVGRRPVERVPESVHQGSSGGRIDLRRC